MSRRCTLTGIRAQSGNKVSHSQRKTRRRFNPNVQTVSLRSDILNRDLKLKVTVATLRTVEHNGGLDNYLLTTRATHLTEDALKLKKRLKKAAAKKAA